MAFGYDPPVITKTWQFNVNNGFEGATGVQAAVLFAIKNALCTFASNPWTVVASCDGTNVSMTGTDFWSSAANVLWGEAGVTAHSWIVLQQTEMQEKFQLLIDCGDVSNLKLNLQVSFGVGFGAANGGADGTTLVAPTALDGKRLLNPGGVAPYYWGCNGGDEYVHAMMSTDGKNTRVILGSAGYSQGFWVFDTLQKSPDGMSGFVPPIACFANGVQTGSAVATAFFNNTWWWAKVNGTVVNLGCWEERAYNFIAYRTNVDPQTAHWPTSEAMMWYAGRHYVGSLVDIYLFHPNYNNNADHAPIAPDTKAYVCLRGCWLPWNGTGMMDEYYPPIAWPGVLRNITYWPAEIYLMQLSGTESAVATKHCIMRAIDSGVSPGPGYVVWHSSPTPDFVGAGYLAGSPTPIGPMVAGSAVVIDEWTA